MATERFEWTDKKPMYRATYFGVKAVCMFIEAESKRRAPVDTGNLRRSLSTAMESDTTSPTAEGRVGTNVDYAIFQEYGTRNSSAQPYLGPALAMARRKYA